MEITQALPHHRLCNLGLEVGQSSHTLLTLCPKLTQFKAFVCVWLHLVATAGVTATEPADSGDSVAKVCATA